MVRKVTISIITQLVKRSFKANVVKAKRLLLPGELLFKNYLLFQDLPFFNTCKSKLLNEVYEEVILWFIIQ